MGNWSNHFQPPAPAAQALAASAPATPAPARGRHLSVQQMEAVRSMLLREFGGDAMAMMRQYAAADHGRRTRNWRAGAGSANAMVGRDLPTLRARSSQLVRDNPHARKVLSVLVDQAVGYDVIATPDTGSDVHDRALKAAWEEFIEDCDITGRAGGFGDFIATGVHGALERGDVVTRLLTQEYRRGAGVPLKLQLMEGDFIDGSAFRAADSANRIVDGVEVNGYGRPIQYWLYNQHPGDSFGVLGARGLASQPVPAARCVHFFNHLSQRIGQQRGVPELTSVMLLASDLGDYEEAELMRKKIEACLAAFVTQADGEDGPGAGDTSAGTTPDAGGTGSLRLEEFYPAMIAYLKDGESVTISDPKPSQGYEAYKRSRLRDMATGGGIMYQDISGDLSDVNYSSYRAGLIGFRRHIEALRWRCIVPRFCQPIWNAFVAHAHVAGMVRVPKARVTWHLPRFESVDPVKDAVAALMELRSGLQTHKGALAERGEDYDKTTAQLAKEKADRNRLQLVLDLDPAVVSKAGVTQARPDGSETLA
jgi:lambda family phage portal protein